MAHSDYRLVSIPHRVFWGGWETTTTQMQQCGWQISADQDFHYRGVRIAFQNEAFGIFGYTDYQRADMMFDRMGLREPLYFQVVRMGALRSHFVHSIDRVSAFAPIDAYPQMISNDEIRKVEDLKIFATPLVRTEQIIVEPHDVMRLLERIKEIQMPEQAAIRARARLRDYMKEGDVITTDVSPRQTFHAQILSIAA